ncbi:MaoC/PaaZ C-terminal domain-containing protein [Desulfosporosinus sp.]|uniref:MaoC/PaaZ C-terminal domain-containing protein n=1 Tax=Desulfosporosinus sp. TaxID=157907 RepID=UPI002602DBAD|nr:MaoC/PaaZ C-terminal domain-containing protein [Desulfosporosinus sp.]
MAPEYTYENLEIGMKFTSPARTVTVADIVNFAGVSGDYNALHVDAEYAKNSIFGERVAHGLLGLAIGFGLFTRTELNLGLASSALSLLGINSWKFKGPIRIDDTIHLEIEVTDKQETSKPDRGVVVFTRSLVNQRGEVVQVGEVPMLLKRETY